jgi:hypothetical protein
VGDATNPSDVTLLMAADFTDLVFTDPPYNVDYEGYRAETEDQRRPHVGCGLQAVSRRFLPRVADRGKAGRRSRPAYRSRHRDRNQLSLHLQRFEFVLTPKHGSWLNIVETMFGKMARSMLRGIRVASKQELIDRLA